MHAVIGKKDVLGTSVVNSIEDKSSFYEKGGNSMFLAYE